MRKSTLTDQLAIESQFDQNQLHTRVEAEFIEDKDFDFAELIHLANLKKKFGFRLLAQMALFRRAKPEMLLGAMAHFDPSLQKVANQIEQAVDAGLLYWDGRIFHTRFLLPSDVQKQIELYQFPLPLVVPPKEVKSNAECGYYVNQSSVILNNGYHQDDVCLDHINRVNKVPYKININTANMIKNKWRNHDIRKSTETPADFQKRQRAFNKYDRNAKAVLDLLNAKNGLIYFDHKYDSRGRTYCVGYHVNYQGTEWNKAVVEFGDPEIIEE